MSAPVLVVLLAACGGGPRKQVIQNKGSDTLVNVAQAWAEAYRTVNPEVAVAVSGGGSGTGISALINGTVDIANASRKMKAEEIEAARKNGVEPVEHTVGFDALAVFLHPTNPMSEMTFRQLADIYGEHGAVTKWSDLGISVPGCGSDEIVVVSRQNNSGTYAYFKEVVLGGSREYRLGTLDMHGSKDVADLVAETPCAIGYSGLAYASDHVKVPCLKADDGASCVAPTPKTAADGSYPIARPLIMYTAGEPDGAIRAYLDWVKSEAGQCLIVKDGYAAASDVSCR